MKLVPCISMFSIKKILKEAGFYDEYTETKPFETLFFREDWSRRELRSLYLGEEWICPDEENEEAMQRNIIRSILRPHFGDFDIIIVDIF